MKYIYTNGQNKDFIDLCNQLDGFLNKLVGGEENRKEYVQYNHLDNIHDAIVAYVDNEPVACGGFKRFDNETVEVKRVFVKAQYRKQGIAKQLMNQLEQKALEKGFKRLILETGEPLVGANHLYKKNGYQIIPNYGQYIDMPESICYEKIL